MDYLHLQWWAEITFYRASACKSVQKIPIFKLGTLSQHPIIVKNWFEVKIGTNKMYLCANYEVLTTNSHGDTYQNSVKYGQFTLGTLSCMKYLVKSFLHPYALIILAHG